MKGTCGQLRLATGFVAFTLLSVIYLIASDQLGQQQVVQVLSKQLSNAKPDIADAKSEWLVDGPHCRIRNHDPFDPSILQYLGETAPVVCSHLPALTHIVRQQQNKPVLTVNQAVVDRYKLQGRHKIVCCWSTLTRISQNNTNYNQEADNKYKFSTCVKFQDTVQLPATAEFVHVRCQSMQKKANRGKNIYENMHAIAAEKRPKTSKPTDPKLNVVILGIDSVSRLSLRRTMPETLAYLTQNNWIEMNGYNKIADNTFPNLMAILSGRTVGQIHDVCLKERIPIMDNCPSLLTDFRQRGYLTSYAEDVPSLSTFNYKMNGFVDPPTDYYMRPFMLAAHAQLPVRNKDGLPICVGPQSAADVMFDYARDIIATTLRQNVPHFGLFWLNSFSHNEVNAPAALDQRLLTFLRQIEQLGSLNNTLVLILSDHGIRFGKIRNAFLGFLEERLPFLFLHLPQRFLETYPIAHQNLLNNQHRLTSPYDLHATLSSLLTGGQPRAPPACPSCTSLFEPIPQNRTCSDAGIDTHWCTCPNFTPVNATDPLVAQVGQYLFERVLNRTQELIAHEKAPPDLCEHRNLAKITRAHRSIPIGREGQPDDPQIFVIVIETQPFGVFEATVTVKPPKFTVVGFISRLDSYFTTSKCVQSKMLQFYCHCSVL